MVQRSEQIASRFPRRPRPVPRDKEIQHATPIERLYLAQGYVLPDGLTWAMVAGRRRRWRIDPIFVPVAVGPGCLGWGVPFVDGRPLNHP